MDRVAQLEGHTNCEVVFHFRKDFNGEPLEEAKRLFAKFGLHKTEDHNGILIVIAVRTRQFAVWADQGVVRRAHDKLWDEVCHDLSHHFKADQRLNGMIAALDRMEKILAVEQPSKLGKSKHNELSNKPIVGDD